MPSGLAALLDDVAAIAKLAAASVDDIGAAAGRAGVKAAGVVVDDAAVTPRYVTGFTPDRELPIIARIAKGSFINKLLIILPVILLLSEFLPWSITPLLMLGGAYLCYEGAEKLYEAFSGPKETLAEEAAILDSAEHEKTMIKGAIRTDFILSAEIMVIALNEVTAETLTMRAVTLAVVAVAITVAVYGAVGLIVKMDDIGLRLARTGNGAARAFGRGLVKAMPIVMKALSVIGIAAMIWVGGQILVHGMEVFGFAALPHFIHDTAKAVGEAAGGLAEWVANAVGGGIVGLIVGAILVAIHHAFAKAKPKAAAA